MKYLGENPINREMCQIEFRVVDKLSSKKFNDLYDRFYKKMFRIMVKKTWYQIREKISYEIRVGRVISKIT